MPTEEIKAALARALGRPVSFVRQSEGGAWLAAIRDDDRLFTKDVTGLVDLLRIATKKGM